MKNNTYDTTDMGLAAFLSLKGIEINDVDKSNSYEAVFKFERSDLLDEFIESYNRSGVNCNARLYGDSLKHLKNRIIRY